MAAEMSGAEDRAPEQAEGVYTLQSARGAVCSGRNTDMVQEGSTIVVADNKELLVPTISNISALSATHSEPIGAFQPASEAQQVTETYTAVSTTLQEIQKLQQFVADIVPVVAKLKDDKQRAEETVETLSSQLESCMVELDRLARTKHEMHESKALAQKVALQASDQCHSLKKELWEVRTVNNDLCLEIERLKEASECNAWAALEHAKVMEDLEAQKERAADAESERAEAVKLMIQEKDRTRRTEEALGKAEQDRDVAIKALQGEREAAFWAERQVDDLRNENHMLLQKLEASTIAAEQEMTHECAEIHAEPAQDTFSAHSDDHFDDEDDEDHLSQHSTLLNSMSVPAIMPGEIQNKYLQEALDVPRSLSEVYTPRRVTARPVVPPLPLQSMSFNSASSVCKPSDVTFRLLKDFVALPPTPKVSSGTPLLQRSEKLSNGPFDVPNSVPAALANKKCGKDGGKTRTRAFWNRLRRFTGVLTACATHPQSQMYDRLR